MSSEAENSESLAREGELDRYKKEKKEIKYVAKSMRDVLCESVLRSPNHKFRMDVYRLFGVRILINLVNPMLG
jgi:hypothetical protein